MKTRFFYAAGCFNTWSKLFVLSEDGKFYCEYLNYMKHSEISKQFNFETFKAQDYSFDNYQTIKEISKEEAISTRLTRQINWVNSYISKFSNIESEDLKTVYLNKLKTVGSLKLLIVGQDPYPNGANGIAFCKDTFEELQDQFCCGKDVLFSLGVDIESAKDNFNSPVDLFFDLLEQGIAFINVNHELNSNNSKPEKYRDYNLEFLEKAPEIVVLGLSTAKDAFEKHYSEYIPVNCLIHPSGRNKTNQFTQWNLVWNNSYLKNNFLN